MTDSDERLMVTDLTHGLYVTYRCPDGTLLPGRISVEFIPAADMAGSISINHMPGSFFMGVPKAITEKMQ